MQEAFVRDTFELIDRIDGLARDEDIRSAVLDLLVQAGFDHFTITRLPMPHERLGPYMMLKAWPDSWLQRYDQQSFYRVDPIARRCMETVHPFLWSEIPVGGADGERVMREAEDYGLKVGLCVPLFDADGFQGAVSMAGERIELPSRVRRAIHMLSLYAYGAAERIHRNLPELRTQILTTREREALRWSAAGKTAWEISSILSISERTVIAHLTSARRKLGTTNATQTVVEALRRREIRL